MSQEGFDMIGDDNWFETLRPLEELAMGYEVAVFPLFAQDYLQEFYDWFRIRDRDRRAKLIPSEDTFLRKSHLEILPAPQEKQAF